MSIFNFRSKRNAVEKVAPLFGLFLASLSLSGCAPENSQRYNSGENGAEIESLLNSREYGKAIWIIESREGKNPADREKKEFLAQALLGRAGFEPLSFGARVAGSFEEHSQNKLMGSCSKSPIAEKSPASLGCLARRIAILAPRLNRQDLERALALLRQAHPNIRETPPWKNALVGTIELVSLFARVGRLYEILSSQKREEHLRRESPSRPLKEELLGAWFEAQQALERAQNSGEKINRLLTGSRSIILFRVFSDSATYVEIVGLKKFFDFLRTHASTPTMEIQYGDMIDSIEELLESS
jgi:hypothetical protein